MKWRWSCLFTSKQEHKWDVKGQNDQVTSNDHSLTMFSSCFSISLKMKLTIKCLWTVSLGQLRELKKNQYKLLLNIYLVFTKDKKEKPLYVGYEESFRDEVGLWKFLVKDGNWWLRNKKFWYNLNVLNCKDSSLYS